MGFLKVYRSGREEGFREILFSEVNFKGSLLYIKIETCFYVQFDESKCTDDKWMEVLKRILGNSWDENLGILKQSLFLNPASNQTAIEVGPRLNFSTPWSTNCVSICKSSGLIQVERLERATRYLLTFAPNLDENEKERIINTLYDPMTQQINEKPLESLSDYKSPENWSRIDVIGEGRRALEEANFSMGLAFDDWDLDYYTRMFQEVIGRNPSTVELFDLAQSNSEHSRHWFFKGQYEIDGRKLDRSLLDMVMDTNTPYTTNKNNVIKFTDNSSGIIGWKVPLMIQSDPENSSEFCLANRLRHIIFTAETHNFPTGVSPFSGATTGTGGRIRDVQSAGKGGHVIAGTAGYCYGNLHIEDYQMPWEKNEIYPSNFASPLQVLVQASNGASDYGNKFGEPIICGFSRSFGMIWGNEDLNERREWIKPIMFSGGIGSLDENMVYKIPPSESQLVVKLGGPAYRIGVGGGAASSVQVQGDNTLARDLGAVQRGDAEMEQKLNRVIRSCLEMDLTPILAIHDQGAGGNANVLKELMEGAGGVIFTKAFTLGDPTLSTLEIWGAEYQESNALLVNPSQFPVLENLCSRERCPVDKVGFITNDRKVRLYETQFTENPKPDDEDLPVNLELDWVLGKMPKKVFRWTKAKVIPRPLTISGKENISLTLKMVLRLPSVASKRYLTTKVDRSVTGLVAQQQCVGPLHTPLADVAVNAISYFSKKGAATSIGEQPIKILINPKAGARMTVLEALSNLVSCLITDIKDVKCSANWMWAAKLEGEGYALYEACESMCGLMMMLGIGVDGGKDSLSMAARVPHPTIPSLSTVVKAPGSLVISAYAPCPDITKVITPDLKSPGNNTTGALILIKPAFKQFRVGGSAVAQVYSQTGFECPDVNEEQIYKFINCFKAIQYLIKENLLLSLHDISDGGLAVCLIEMAIAGWGGIDVKVPECQAELITEAWSIYCEYFNEEVGWVAEIDAESVTGVMEIFKEHKLEDVVRLIGCTTTAGPAARINFIYRDEKECPVISLSVAEAAQMWEETSYRIECLQTIEELASAEYHSLFTREHTKENINFTWNKNNFNEVLHRHPSTPIMAVIREEGSNGDRELVAAFIQAGFIVHDVTMSDLMDRVVNLDQFRGIAFPGGFSYADVLGSGVGWAASIKEREEINKALEKWRNKRTTFSLGICNGCQLLSLLGWIGIDNSNVPSVRLDHNVSNRFESRWSRVRIRKSNSILLKGMDNSTLGIWVAHGEGKFSFKSNNIKEILWNKNCVALQYVDDHNIPTEKYPFNPNGSEDGIAGMTSICGRHLALMPHPERCVLTWQCPTTKPSNPESSLVAPWSKLFQNAFDWCLKTM